MRFILCTVLVMSSALAQDPGRVIGIGGIFIKSANHENLQTWYQERLGLQAVSGQGVTLKWRSHEKPENEHITIWSAFPDTSNYFDHSAVKGGAILDHCAGVRDRPVWGGAAEQD